MRRHGLQWPTGQKHEVWFCGKEKAKYGSTRTQRARLVPHLLRILVLLLAQRKWRRRAVLQLSRARGPPRKIGVTTSTERLRWVALAYVVGVTLDVSWQIIEGRSWFFSGSAMSLAPSSINREKKTKGNNRRKPTAAVCTKCNCLLYLLS